MIDDSKTWLFVLPWGVSYPGGVNQVVINLIDTFQKTKAIKPKLLIDQYPSDANSIGGASIDYLPLANPFWSPGILGLIKYLLKLPSLFFRVHRHISPDIKCINPHYPSLNVLNFVLYKKIGFYKGKIILSFHGADLLSVKKTFGLEKHLWRFIFTEVDFLTCCSQKLADELIEYINNSAINHKIIVIHNGINLQTMQTDPDSNFLPNELKHARFILNVATFEHKKGQDILIRAFSKIKQSSPIKLVLIGRSSDYLANLRELVQQLHCKTDVIFIENLDHKTVLNFFQRAEIFCLPSRYEPFGIVILEAGFFSCPVVASNVGGIPEIIENGYDGCLVDAENVDELAGKLNELMNDNEVAQKMARRLKNKVINTYTWDIASSKYLSLLNQR